MERQKPSILIIDDDVQLTCVLGDKLEYSGFRVYKAYNGQEGIAAAKEKKPDLIILDLRMPGIDGAEVLAVLKSDESTKNIKIAIFTSFNQYFGIKLSEASAKKIGADAFIEKEADLDEVVKKSKDLLGVV